LIGNSFQYKPLTAGDKLCGKILMAVEWGHCGALWSVAIITLIKPRKKLRRGGKDEENGSIVIKRGRQLTKIRQAQSKRHNHED
jgi:hypothetical protein